MMALPLRSRRRADRGRPDLVREVEPYRVSAAPATDRLYARLPPGAVDAVERRLADDEAELWDGLSDAERRWVTLAYGVNHRVPEVLEPTGLSPAEPPEDVHAMARGALAAGGAYPYADMVAAAAQAAGLELGDATRALDFGCSSGRVVRVLAAAWPAASWEGCDPNAAAVAWAKANIPGGGFFVSPQAPPLPRREGAYELVCAISVWSHFAPEPARAWLAELARVTAPGGVLVLTTHGATSVAHEATLGRRSPSQLEEIVWTLYRRGHWYRPEFGPTGDWGVSDPGWGTAFLSPEWLLRETAADWRVEAFWPGGAERNQDVWALRRA